MMISAITYAPQIIYRNKSKTRFCHLYTQPKSDNISFTSKNLLSLSSDRISKIVKVAIEETNFIGSGKEGEVYKIPDTDYCIKILKRNLGNRTNFGKWTTEIDEIDKANHILAKAENGSTIMKYINGTSLFTYPDIENIVNLPESIFKQLLKQVYEAQNLGLAFDNAPTNLIYNIEKQTLIAIDFYKPDFEFEIFPYTRICTVLAPGVFKNHNINTTKKWTGKLLNIALEEYSKKNSHEFYINDDDIIRCVNRFEFLYKDILSPEYKFLKQSFIDIINLKKAQRRGEEVDRELTGKIKYAKSIVGQILTDI